MLISPPPLEIGLNEGFSPQKDIFGHAKLGAGLTNLMSTLSEPAVLGLDGRWGSGKSTFLKMWAGELRNVDFPVIYFDAFEHDYTSDAFSAIAGEIIDLAQTKKGGVAKKIGKTALATGRVLLQVGASVAVRAATAGLLNAADLGDVAEGATNIAGDETDRWIQDHLLSRKKERATFAAFRSALSELPSLLTKSGKPLVLIVDELDRCRPSFALSLLERIKHFFSVKNVHFVLGAHFAQLENSVKATYGADIDAHMYLQKFVHLTVALTQNPEDKHERIEVKFIRHLKKVMEFSPDDRETVDYTFQVIEHIARRKQLSLRTLEKISTQLAISLIFTPKNYLRPQPILGALCTLKVTSPDLYAKARAGVLRFEEMNEALLPGSDGDDASLAERLRDWWKICTGEEPADEGWAQAMRREYSFRYSTRVTNFIPYVANDMIDRFSPR